MSSKPPIIPNPLGKRVNIYVQKLQITIYFSGSFYFGRYFVVANAIACSYGALSLILILAKRGQKKGLLTLTTIILDLAMVALLASGNGAATAIGVIGYQGNSNVHWNKVCDMFGRFCHQVLVAVVVSLLGSLSFLFLVMLAALDLHKKHYQQKLILIACVSLNLMSNYWCLDFKSLFNCPLDDIKCNSTSCTVRKRNN